MSDTIKQRLEAAKLSNGCRDFGPAIDKTIAAVELLVAALAGGDEKQGPRERELIEGLSSGRFKVDDKFVGHNDKGPNGRTHFCIVVTEPTAAIEEKQGRAGFDSSSTEGVGNQPRPPAPASSQAAAEMMPCTLCNGVYVHTIDCPRFVNLSPSDNIPGENVVVGTRDVGREIADKFVKIVGWDICYLTGTRDQLAAAINAAVATETERVVHILKTASVWGGENHEAVIEKLVSLIRRSPDGQ